MRSPPGKDSFLKDIAGSSLRPTLRPAKQGSRSFHIASGVIYAMIQDMPSKRGAPGFRRRCNERKLRKKIKVQSIRRASDDLYDAQTKQKNHTPKFSKQIRRRALLIID